MMFSMKDAASRWKDRLSELPELDEREVTALASAGLVALCGTIHAAHRRRVYKRAVAKELKKQLAPINQKLDAIQAENNRLRSELARQQGPKSQAADLPEV